jgi:hypothetical protein
MAAKPPPPGAGDAATAAAWREQAHARWAQAAAGLVLRLPRDAPGFDEALFDAPLSRCERGGRRTSQWDAAHTLTHLRDAKPPCCCLRPRPPSCRFVDVQVDVTGATLAMAGPGGTRVAAPGATFAGFGGASMAPLFSASQGALMVGGGGWRRHGWVAFRVETCAQPSTALHQPRSQQHSSAPRATPPTRAPARSPRLAAPPRCRPAWSWPRSRAAAAAPLAHAAAPAAPAGA